MLPPSDHLLRTFAAVPVRSRVLDLGCGRGRHTEPLVQLGFDLYACDAEGHAVAATRARLSGALGAAGVEARITTAARLGALGYPDAFFDWVVAYDAYERASSHRELLELLAETRRVLKPGGWVYLTVPAVPEDLNPNQSVAGYASDSGLPFAFTAGTLRDLMQEAGYAEAEQPARMEEGGQPRLRAIYRRLDAGTPV